MLATSCSSSWMRSSICLRLIGFRRLEFFGSSGEWPFAPLPLITGAGMCRSVSEGRPSLRHR